MAQGGALAGARRKTVQTSQETRIVPAPRKRAGPQQSHLLREILETVLLTALVYFVVRASVQFTPVDGPSMQPGLHTGESVIVNELAYRFGSPQRGDVIVFHPPSSPDVQYIKRVIAVPGDTITITDAGVSVDGVILYEPYVAHPEDDVAAGQLPQPLTLKLGEYWVMGDNRGNSSDSRSFSTVPLQNIVGKAELVIWPINTLHWLPTYRDVFAGVKQ
jgi:signal peptidase I